MKERRFISRQSQGTRQVIEGSNLYLVSLALKTGWWKRRQGLPEGPEEKVGMETEKAGHGMVPQ